MLFSCPRCTGGANLASQNQLFGSLAENGRFLNKPLIWKCYFPVPAALVWCPFGVPKSEFGSLAENARFLNKPLIWKCYFPVPAALGAHLASQNQSFGSLAENGRFLNKPLIWKCYFPVPAALVSIWRPEIGIWEPCRKWSIS